jgi:hypothetical protein
MLNVIKKLSIVQLQKIICKFYRIVSQFSFLVFCYRKKIVKVSKKDFKLEDLEKVIKKTTCLYF